MGPTSFLISLDCERLLRYQPNKERFPSENQLITNSDNVNHRGAWIEQGGIRRTGFFLLSVIQLNKPGLEQSSAVSISSKLSCPSRTNI